MIWHYFPIGFRFPVADFSEETKRRCWQITLDALCAAEGFGTTLYEAQEPYDYGTDGPVYICIACYEKIKQSRSVGKALFDLDTLMTSLCLHQTFVQANYLESFGPYPILGTFGSDGTIATTDEGAAFLPKTANAMNPVQGKRLLIAAAPTDTQIAETVTRLLGKAAVKNGCRAERLLLPRDDADLVRALVSAKSGRYETVAYTDDAGARHSATIGVLPGTKVVLNAEDYVPAVLEKAKAYGYRQFVYGENTMLPIIASEGCSFETWDENDVLERIGLDAKADTAEAVCLFLPGVTPSTEAVLKLLDAKNKPVCLLCADPSAEAQRLTEAFPCIISIVQCTQIDETIDAALSDALDAL